MLPSAALVVRVAAFLTVAGRGYQFTAEGRWRKVRGQAQWTRGTTAAAPAVVPRLSIVVLPFIN